jgi:hypothetical protein
MNLEPTTATCFLGAFFGGESTPNTDLFVGDGVLKALYAHRASVAVRLGFDDETPDAFLEKDVARYSVAECVFVPLGFA